MNSEITINRTKTEMWAEFISIIPFPAFIKNGKGQYIYCNSRFSKDIYNKEVSDLIGKTIFDLKDHIDPILVENSHKRDLKILEYGGEIKSDTEILCVDGKVHFFQEIKSRYTNEETKEKYILGILVDVTEKAILQKELSFEHDILSALLNNSTDNIYFKDSESRFIKVSKTCASKHNLKPEEMQGKTDFDLFGQMYSAESFNDEKYIMHSGISIIGKEEKEDWADGKITWVSTSKMPLYDNKGRIIGTIGISRNITNKKKSEEEKTNSLLFSNKVSEISNIFLRHGAANFQDAFNIVMKELSLFIMCKKSFAYFWNDRESIFKKISEYPAMSSYEPEYCNINRFTNWLKMLENSETVFDLKQFPASEEMAYLVKQNLTHIVIIPLTNYTSLVGFIAFECTETTRIWLQNYQSLFNILNEIISNAFTNHELEKYRLDAEEEMLKFLRAVNQSTNIIMILDNHGSIEYVNSKFSEATGYSFDEMIGKKPSFLSPNINLQFNVNHLMANLLEGIPWEGKYQDYTKSDKMFWVQMSISPIRNSQYEITNILVIQEDITDKVIIEGRKAISQKLESIGQLAAGIAHEINTPMQFIGDNTSFLNTALTPLNDFISQLKSSIKNNTSPESLILNQELENLLQKYDIDYLLDEIPSAIQQTLSGVQHVTNIVRAMKDFAHPGKKEKVFTNINHGIEVTSIISKNEWKYAAKLELNLSEELPLVYCMQDELNQVFLSMIINASHAILEKIENKIYEQGKITIETYREKEFAVIRICDNGMGIEESNLEKIFDPFFTTKEVGRGTGQGLAIVHDLIVNKHKGDIFVNSVYGEGTTFTIKIPVEK